MKFFTRSLFLLVLTAALSAGAQHYVPLEPLNRNAILEEFTGVNCPNCPAGHQVMAQILEDNPGRAFCVAYHPYNSSYTTPTAGDPDFRRHFADSLYMTPYCGTSRFMPSSFIQRRLWSPPERLMSRTVWAQHTATVLSEASPMNVGMATSYDDNAKLLTVVVDIYYTDDVPGDHNLMVTLAENNLVSHQSGGTYPYTHKHTFREAFVGQWGDPIQSGGVAGTFYTRIFTFDYSATDYIMENCELLAFVIDNASEEVITGIGCAAGDTTYVTPDVSLTADTLFYENPQQCVEGQIVTLSNQTDTDVDLLLVQQESSASAPFLWMVDPWPFTGFPLTLAPGQTIDLNVVIPLPVDGRMEFLYDNLMIISEADTHFVTLAVNEGLYMGMDQEQKLHSGLVLTNYPNPFSDATTIIYQIPVPTRITLEVYNLSGHPVATLIPGSWHSEKGSVAWNGTNDAGLRLPAGVYLLRLITPEETLTRLVLLKD